VNYKFAPIHDKVSVTFYVMIRFKVYKKCHTADVA